MPFTHTLSCGYQFKLIEGKAVLEQHDLEKLSVRIKLASNQGVIDAYLADYIGLVLVGTFARSVVSAYIEGVRVIEYEPRSLFACPYGEHRLQIDIVVACDTDEFRNVPIELAEIPLKIF